MKQFTLSQVAEVDMEVESQDVLQAAHDICSPVSALKILVAKADQIPLTDLKQMLALTVVRIEQVTESLLASARTEKQALGLTLCNWFEQKKLELDMEVELVLLADSGVRYGFLVDGGMARVLSNLVNNAVDAGATRVTLHVWKTDCDMAFAVSDDGHGFPGEVVRALEQGRSISVGKDGHGLGLSHAYRYAKARGGQFQLVITHPAVKLVLVRIPLS